VVLVKVSLIWVVLILGGYALGGIGLFGFGNGGFGLGRFGLGSFGGFGLRGFSLSGLLLLWCEIHKPAAWIYYSQLLLQSLGPIVVVVGCSISKLRVYGSRTTTKANHLN
jgi:hypothetical protein